MLKATTSRSSLDALAESRNVPAVKLAQQVGMTKVVEYARRFGINSPIPAYLPVALGAADLTLYEQTSAYSVFPNDGVRMEPHYIRKVMDYEGHVLEETYPEARDVTSAHTARTMVSLLQSVVQYGTAASASKLGYGLNTFSFSLFDIQGLAPGESATAVVN